jgi:type II secretory pathway component GspD/PulD (secretin)
VLALALAFAGLTDARGDSPAAPTTAPQASELVVYTVGDIVSSAPAGAGEKSVPAEARTAWPATLAELTDLIKQRITPNVWSSAARIDADERTGQLVVLAPPDTQAAVAKFLGQMSKEAKTSITIRAYILTFDPSTAQSLKLPPNSEPMTLLTAERYQELLKAARNASPTGSNSILFAPKIITRNHEQCAVQVGTDTAYVSDIVPTNLPGKATVTASDGTIYEVKNATINAGFKLSIDPVISKDGKYVSVAFKAALTDLLGFQTATVNGNPLLKYQVPLVMTNSIEGEASVPNGGIVAMNLPVGQDDFPGSGATKPAHAGQVELILTATINP